MTKLDIINEVASMTGFSKVETELIIESIIKCIKISLAKNKRIDIRGFGSFFVKKRASRDARNPATNQIIHLNDRYIPAFKVSKLLKKYVDQSIKSE